MDITGQGTLAEDRLRAVSAGFAYLAGAIALLVLAGWSLQEPVLTAVLPTYASMKPWTAMSLIFIAAACLQPARSISARFCAAPALAIGLASASEYLFEWNLGIDTVLFADALFSPAAGSQAPYPGRMAPATAGALIGLAGGVLLAGWRPLLAQALAVAVMAASTVALIGYLFDVQALYRIAPFVSVALHTATALLLLSLSLLFATGLRGVNGVIFSRLHGAVMVRRLLPAAVGLALIVGYLSDQAYEAADGIAVFTAALMVLFGGVVLWTGGHLNRLDACRRLAEESSRNMARRFAALQESERRALARELHDRIGPNLCALGSNLAALGNHSSLESSVRERIADSLTLLEATGVAVTNALADLRPPLLEKRGLLEALRWQAAEFSRRTGISVDVIASDVPSHADLDFDMALFRIAEGALSNVLKHAKARSVILRLHPSRTVWLEVADNGVGFDPQGDSGASRLGLTAMRERAEAVDGTLQVYSAPGRGTRVVVGALATQ